MHHYLDLRSISGSIGSVLQWSRYSAEEKIECDGVNGICMITKDKVSTGKIVGIAFDCRYIAVQIVPQNISIVIIEYIGNCGDIETSSEDSDYYFLSFSQSNSGLIGR